MKGFRTIIVNLAVVLTSILAMSEWQDIIPAQYWPHFVIGVATINLLLRFVTTTPVGNKT